MQSLKIFFTASARIDIVMIRLIPVDIFPVSHAIEHYISVHHIVPDPIEPDAETPLTNTSAFEFLDRRWRTKGM